MKLAMPLADRRTRSEAPRPNVFWYVALGLASVAVGFMLVGSTQTEANARPAIVGSSTRDLSGDTVLRLESQQRALKQTVADLQRQIEQRQTAASTRQKTLVGLTQELEQQRMLAGTVPLVGPGVRVILDDSTRQPAPNDDLNNYIIHDYELRDVINVLWQGGAEAISLNGERMTSVSSLYCVGSTILANSTRLSPYYEIVAIGNPATLEEALNHPNHLRKLRSAVRQYGVQFRFERAPEVTVPAYSGHLEMKYASPNGGA